ncbi:hypothetical protein B0T22DRAFT_460407 [Podospora appendiculata]|uniref:Uncharacterized protein n=1 Tax=Podospora appendiculata TaxID=314037 RepID=A0AAE0XA32_9PEZI|nr:hypothetical protein B0T22DRAFT_460407 [Podospora appendiculata]
MSATPPPTAGQDDPPSYREQDDDPDQPVQPNIFVLAGLCVHAETVDSAPLYQLSRAIDGLEDATSTIEFERLDHRVRTHDSGTLSVTKRSKHLYNLQHMTGLFALDFPCSLEPMSTKGLGRVCLAKSPFPHSGFRASKLMPGRGVESEKGEVFFVVKEKKKGVFVWSDAKGRVVATQDDAQEGRHLLLVAVPLPRRMMDGLVALWCLWVWHRHSEALRQPLRWKDGELDFWMVLVLVSVLTGQC